MTSAVASARRQAETIATSLGLDAGSLALVFGAAFTLAFLVLGPSEQQDVHDDLANAFLNARLWVPAGSHWELVPIDEQRAWSPFPPVPAVTYMPFMALGVTPTSTFLAAVAGGAGVALMLLCLTRMEVPLRTAGWLTLGVAGATYGWLASSGSLWFYPEVLGTALSVAALYLALEHRSPLLSGILLGLAAGSRLPTGMLVLLLAYLYWPQRDHLVKLVAGVTLIAVPVALYNVARFGSPLEFGYGLIESFWHPGEPVTAEPYFRHGVLDISYIPRSLAAMLLQGYEIRLEFPWVAYPVSGVSVALSAPTLLLALLARPGRLMAVAWLTFVAIMLPNWAHGSWGFWHFGYRFIVDATAPLLVLLGLAYRNRGPGWLLPFTAVLGTVATLYAWAAELWWNFRSVPPSVLP